eukprot:gene30459-45727_t
MAPPPLPHGWQPAVAAATAEVATPGASCTGAAGALDLLHPPIYSVHGGGARSGRAAGARGAVTRG